MKKLAIVIAAIALIGTPAFAADMAVKMPVKAPPPLPASVYSWTGFYIGGNAGWVRERDSGISDFINTAVPGSAFFSNPQSNALSDSGFIGGGQVGYNWQVAPHVVLGAEGDWDWLRTKYNFCSQTDIIGATCTDNGRGFETISGQTEWLATVRARAGVTWDRFMVYGTGGAAWGHVQTTESLSCLVGGCGSSSLKLAASSTVSQTKTGWAAGLGIEGMLDAHWSVKAEWLHVDLGNLSDTFMTVGIPGTQSVVWSRDARFDIVRAGVNYRFGG